ncbi:NADPH-dependent FMN reductase, partial [Escherichia coli]|nr:NADPH-dependent FMN reductase [Escherichia coli]
SLLEYAREKLNGLDVEVYHWNLQNFVPEDLLYARFDSPALKTSLQIWRELGFVLVINYLRVIGKHAVQDLLGFQRT